MIDSDNLRADLMQRDPRDLVWSNTRSIHEAVRPLFNAGYRGRDLTPPPGWPGTLH